MAGRAAANADFTRGNEPGSELRRSGCRLKLYGGLGGQTEARARAVRMRVAMARSAEAAKR